MAIIATKKVCSFSLDADARNCIKQLEDGPFKGVSASSIVQTAILFLHGKHFNLHVDYGAKNARKGGRK